MKAISELYKEEDKDKKTFNNVMKEVNGSFDEIYEDEKNNSKREEL